MRKTSIFRFVARRKATTKAMSARLLLLLLTLTVQAAHAQQSAPDLSQTQTQTAATSVRRAALASSETDERYRIGPGDVLEIRIFKRPELSRESVRVDGRGVIRMPLIKGDIQAICRTDGELAEEIASRYLEYLRNPQVDVFIKEYQSQPVAVLGSVSVPGRFQLHRRIRLLELLSFAGGPTDKAGDRIQMARTAGVPTCEAPTAEVAEADPTKNLFSFKLLDTLKGKEQSNPYVQPGDIITIPEADQAYVVGNVLRPTQILLKERITLTKALAMAGGTMPDTKTDKIRLVRQLPGSTGPTEIMVDLKAIKKHESEDIALQANDIIEVPTSEGKRFFRNLFGSMIPAATQLPVRVVGP
jgi:polysaccharide export outer membrane protein